MKPITISMAGLPEPEEMSGGWNLQPITVKAGEPGAGPRLGFPAGASRRSAPVASGDGVLCVYPGEQTIAYLFSSTLQVRKIGAVPAIVVTTHSAEGICTIFGFAEESNGDPLLIVNILPSEYLQTVLTGEGDSSMVGDLSGIDDRIEIRQTFAANSFGLVSRLTNELTKQPNLTDNTIFEIYDDPGSIADVCAFYMSRVLGLENRTQAAGPDAAAARLRVGDPAWRLLWQPSPSLRCIAGFAAVFILSRLSVSYRRARGESAFSLEFNRAANRRQPRGGNAE